MTKYELVDREKVENITWGEPSYTDALNVLTEVRDKIRELPAITEQEIVKPYLEKLEFSEGYELCLCVGLGYADEAPDAKPRNMEKIKYIE